MATLHQRQGKNHQAEQAYAKAIAIYLKTLPSRHPTVTQIVEQYAAFLLQMNRNADADALLARIAATPAP